MLYSYQCSGCGAIREEFRSVAARNDPLTCSCGQPMAKMLGGHRVIGDMKPYYDENLQAYVKSRQHRKQLMKEQGVSEAYGKKWK